MKKTLSIFIIFSFSILLSQTKYNIGFNYGYFLHHSENKLQITNTSNFTDSYGLNLGRKIQLKDRLYCDINFGFNLSKSEGKLEISDYFFGSDSIYVLYNKSLSSTTEYICPVDINISSEAADLIYYGFGLSIAGIRKNSIYKFYYNDEETNIDDFFDNLSLFGVGLNCFIRFSYPVFNSHKSNLFTEGRIRYISKIFSINRGIDLSDYKYNFTQLLIIVGIEL